MGFEALYGEIGEHAAAEYPNECCGLIVKVAGSVRYMQCRNIADEPDQRDRFVIDPAQYAEAEDAGEILAVVHSHPDASANPSESDRVMCEESGLPWLIMGWPSGVTKIVNPCGYEAPLVGRGFAHGVLDCYTLVRDYYARKCGIDLPDFPRSNLWWDRGENLYMQQFEKAGFVRVDGPPQLHDGLIMQVLAPVPNHAGVYVRDNVLLHHLYGRPSEETTYRGGYFERATVCVVRHRSLLDAA